MPRHHLTDPRVQTVIDRLVAQFLPRTDRQQCRSASARARSTIPIIGSSSRHTARAWSITRRGGRGQLVLPDCPWGTAPLWTARRAVAQSPRRPPHRHGDGADELTGPALDIVTADGANHALRRHPHRRLTGVHVEHPAAERHGPLHLVCYAFAADVAGYSRSW
jgi:hypothetical protein